MSSTRALLVVGVLCWLGVCGCGDKPAPSAPPQIPGVEAPKPLVPASNREQGPVPAALQKKAPPAPN